jgi:hypothetical protein
MSNELELLRLRKRKAEAIAQSRAASESEAANEDYDLAADVANVAKGFGQAGIDAIDTPYAIRQGIDMIPEKARNVTSNLFPLATAATSFVSDLLPDELSGKAPASDLPGLKQVKEFVARDEDASRGSQAARTAAEWGAGGLRKTVSKAVDVVPDLLMAGGAFLGDLFTDGEALGEVAGGGTGLAASLVRGKGIGAVGEAVKAIKNAADTPPAGWLDDAGTLADITGDKGLYDLQSTLEITPEGRRALDTKELERQKQVVDELREPFGTAPTQPAQDIAGQYVDDIVGDIGLRTGQQADNVQIPYAPQQKALSDSDIAATAANASAQNAAAQAQEGLVKAREPLATNQTLAQSGEGMYDVATAQRAREDEAAGELWDAFREQGDINIRPAVEAASDVFKNVSEIQLKAFRKKYGKEFDWLKGQEGDLISSNDMAKKISDLKSDLRAAYKSDGGVKDVDKTLEKVIKALDESLAQGNDAYNAARAATRKIHEVWDKGAIPDALQGPPELFGRTLPLADEIGAFNARILNEAEIPGMPEAISKRLKSLARRSTNGVDEMFMREYESVMDTMPPEFRRKADALIAAGEKSEAATGLAKTVDKTTGTTLAANEKQGAALQKAIDAEQKAVRESGQGLVDTVGKTNLAKYSKSSNDASKVVNDLIKANDGKGLAALYRQMESLGPEALAGFRAKVGEDLIAKFSKGGDAGGIRAIADEAPLITPDSFKKFQDMRKTLKDSGILDETTASAVDEALRKTASARLRADGKSNLFSNIGEGTNLAISGIAMKLADLVPGSNASLVMTGAIKRYLTKQMSGIKQNSKAHKILNDMILDPQKYLEGVEKAADSEAAVRMITAKINAAIQTQSALTEE